jgi:site-specific DNA-adenine methylase
MLRHRLLPPVSYQGGKRRQAPEIVRHMGLQRGQQFFDLCAGSGAVTLELISRGHDPAKITMVDAGPWGDVWRLVGEGTFDLDRLAWWLSQVPAEDANIADFLVSLRDSTLPSEPEAPYVFLLLQAGAFGGTPVRERGGRWACRAFIRRSGNDGHYSFAPPPDEMHRRMKELARQARGVRGMRCYAHEIAPSPADAVYADPAYRHIPNDYRLHFDAAAFASAHPAVPVYVSEGVPLTANARAIRVRKKGSFRGRESADRSEYLSLFNADWTTPEPASGPDAEVLDLFAG